MTTVRSLLTMMVECRSCRGEKVILHRQREYWIECPACEGVGTVEERDRV